MRSILQYSSSVWKGSGTISRICTSTESLSLKKGHAKKKQKGKKIGLPEQFHEKLKLWSKLLEHEIEANNELLAQDLSKLNNWNTLESFRMCVLNVPLKRQCVHPISGSIAIFHRNGLQNSKLLKRGVPVTVNEMRPDRSLKLISDSYVVESSSETITVTLKGSHVLSADKKYAIVPSQTSGSLQNLRNFLSNDAMFAESGANLVNIAFRAIPMPSLHDRQLKFLHADLNQSQVNAVSAALNEKRPFLCIQGPPGTGKTRVVAEIVRLLMEKKKKVLVCAPSHVAVNNALMATSRHMKPLQANSEAQEMMMTETTDDLLKDHKSFANLETIARGIDSNSDVSAAAKMRKEMNRMREKMYRDVYNSRNVIFTTVTSSIVKRLAFYGWKPDVVIIDEAAQCIEPATWAAIISARRCILVGDPAQLPAVVVSEKALEEKLNISLMERLMNEFSNSNICAVLRKQYRMNDRIMHWSNQHFYNDQLESDPSVANNTLSDIYPSIDRESVLNSPLVMIDMDGYTTRSRESAKLSSKVNYDEAHLLVRYVNHLVHMAGVSKREIAVIAPYFAQVEELRRMLGTSSEFAIDVNSVDAFQGQERDVVIFSLVRDNFNGAIGFLSESRRLNVAITRAKRQFVLIGSGKMMQRDKKLASLYSYLKSEGAVHHVSILDQLLLPVQSEKNMSYSMR